MGIREGKGSFDAADAEGGKVVLHVLFVGMMRGVIGDDTVERAVLQPLLYRLYVLRLAHGRVHFRVCVIGKDDVVRQRKIMRAGLRRDGYAARLRVAQQPDAALRGHMADMHALAQRFRKYDLAGDHHFFRGARNTFQPGKGAVISFVHAAAVRKRFILAVREADKPEIGRIFHTEAHHARGGNGFSVVAQSHGARFLHLSDLGERFALLPFRDGADRPHLAQPDFFCPRDNIADHGGIVTYGLRVGHAAHLREPAAHGRGRAAGDVFLILKPRFAQMNVHIDQAGKDVQALRVYDLCRFIFDISCNSDDFIAIDENVADLFAFGQDCRAAFDEKFTHSSRLPVCF